MAILCVGKNPGASDNLVSTRRCRLSESVLREGSMCDPRCVLRVASSVPVIAPIKARRERFSIYDNSVLR
jgi:hypothetical protein